MFFTYNKDTALPYFSRLEILTVENIYQFKVALFTQIIINNATNVPWIYSKEPLPSLWGLYSSYNNRFLSNRNFHWPKISNKYGAGTFAFVRSKIWENIPSEVKDKFLIPTYISHTNCTF